MKNTRQNSKNIEMFLKKMLVSFVHGINLSAMQYTLMNTSRVAVRSQHARETENELEEYREKRSFFSGKILGG